MPTFTSDYYTFSANGNFTVSFYIDLGLAAEGDTAQIGVFTNGTVAGDNELIETLDYVETHEPQFFNFTYPVTAVTEGYYPYLYFSIYQAVGSGSAVTRYDVAPSLVSDFTVTGPTGGESGSAGSAGSAGTAGSSGVTDDGPSGSGLPSPGSAVAGDGTGDVASNASAGSQPTAAPVSGDVAMSVVSFKPISEKMTLSHTGPVFTVVYICQFVGTFDASYVYQNQATIGTPDYGDYLFGTGAEMYVSATDATIAPNSPYTGTATTKGNYHYTAVFSTITPERLDLPPTARPAVVKGGGLELTEARRKDVNAKAMVNSVGDYYEGLPDFYVPGSEITISWNTSINPATMAQTYSFSTNSQPIWGQAAYAGVMGKITFDSVFEVYAGILIEFWRVTAPVRFRNDGLGWNFQPFDYGYRYLKAGQPVGYVDGAGVFGPVFLDGAGNLLNGNGTGTPTAPVVFPAASGSNPPGYQNLNGLNWAGVGFPVNPFE